MRLELPARLDREEIEWLSTAVGQATEPLMLVGACAGLDPGADLEDGLAWQALRELLTRLFTAPPTAALVTGPVQGGGVGLVCACDVVLATSDASFALPELLFGLVPGAILPVVRGRVGTHGVRHLAMGATAIGVEEALGLGLVDRVVERGEEERVLRHLARLDPDAVRELRELLQPDHLAAIDRGISASRRRLPQAAARLERWTEGEAPWST